jgi:hypothetical protein
MSNGIENMIENEFIPTRGNTKFADVITFVGLNGYGFEADSALSLSSYYRDEDWLWNGIVRAQHPVTGMTRLIHAAKTNNMKSLEKVIKHLAISSRLNLQDANGKTALYWACENKHLKVLKCLLDAKAMPDIPDKTGISALTIAVKRDSVNIVQLLCKNSKLFNDTHRIDFNRCSLHKTTPLMISSARGNYKISRILINQGADVNVVERYGRSALSIASEYNHNEIVKLLCLNGANIDQLDNDSNTPLMYAASDGNTNIITTLCELGADVHLRDELGNTPLMLLCQTTLNNSDHIKNIKEFIRFGSNIHAINHDNESILMMAVKWCEIKVIKYLLDIGVDPNLVDGFGVSALDIAIKKKRNHVVDLLYTYGAHPIVNESDSESDNDLDNDSDDD